jgi:putative ABC transport system permease protein
MSTTPPGRGRHGGGRYTASRLELFRLDLRYAWRSLSKSPGLVGVIVLTLALGIGANTAIFSVVHAVLIEPLPYRDADRLVFVWLGRDTEGYGRGPMSGADLRDLRERTSSFGAVGAIWASGTVALTEDAEPEQLRGALVTSNFFQVLGVEPALGRTFQAGDSAPGAEPVILIGWELFQRRYGGDASVVGRRVHANDQPTTVIGVMPPGFRLLLPADAAVPASLQAWVPFWPDLENGPRGNLFLRVVARMQPGVTIAQARADVAAAAEAINSEHGTRRRFTTEALHTDTVREVRAPLLALFAGVGILLAIACVNIAGLLIARAASRGRETALRLALGASRAQLVRQLLVEGLTLTALGGAAGAGVGYVMLRALLALRPDSLQRIESARIDVTVLAFVAGIAVLWGLLFSLVPLVEVARIAAGRSMQLRGRWQAGARGGLRTRAVLVTGQIALSVVLLVGAGLLLRAFTQLLHVDPGFRTDRQLTFRLALPERYGSRDAFAAFGRELQERLAGIPGVSGVGAISHLPYDDMPNWALLHSPSAPLPPDAPFASARAISAGLFETLGVKLIDGRFFSAGDRDSRHPVAIVDEVLAGRLWPGQSAVGRQVVTSVAGMNAGISSQAHLTIVGVVRNLRLRTLVDSPAPQIFIPWPIAQRNPVAFVVRADGLPDRPVDTSVLAAQVRQAVTALDARLAIYDVRPLDSYVDAALATRRFTMQLAAAFAVSALVLTCVGVYGLLAYAVARREHEFGVRMALGAAATHIRRQVLREGWGFALAGCLAGLIGAIPAARLLERQLYAVRPHDPLTYGTVVVVMLLAVTLACWVPARRATSISPVEALRAE